MKKLIVAASAAVAIMMSSSALAGPFIIDGTDADDHGFASGGANQDGWLYIQRAVENIAVGASLSRQQKTIAVLGSNLGFDAGNAAQSAVALSSTLSSAGWTVVLLNDAEITGFFTNTGSGLLSTGASILYMDSGINNVGGGISSSEQALIDGFATEINAFVGSGGGLFSMAQGYGWLTSLIPGLAAINSSGSSISLTAAGSAAFPGLTNADLSSGPHHKYFENVGILPILGTRTSGGQAIILGGAGGSIIDPTPGAVPESSTWMMMIVGFGAIGGAMRYRRRKINVTYA